jgi:hypothetical protein
MPKQEAPLTHLNSFLPAGTYHAVEEYLRFYKIHLTVTQHRKSTLGDYMHRTHFSNHRISVNGSLNKFSFLITLLHEIAHLLTFEKHGNSVMAHGNEWKTIYGYLLKQFVENKVFPTDIEKELLASLKNPAASSFGRPANQLLGCVRTVGLPTGKKRDEISQIFDRQRCDYSTCFFLPNRAPGL